jgi:hypothetical protein
MYARAARHAKEFFMKNLHKLGIAALALAIVFSFAACNTTTSNGGGGGGSEKLSITGEQVYGYDYKPYPPDKNFTLDLSGIGGRGEIKGGKLSLSIETPSSLEQISDVLDGIWQFPTYYKTVTPSDPSVKGNSFQDLKSADGTKVLRKQLHAGTGSNTSWETIIFVYVDGDVTVSVEGNSVTLGSDTFNTTTTSLALKKGWNTLYEKNVYTGTTVTVTISISNPSTLKWVCGDV